MQESLYGESYCNSTGMGDYVVCLGLDKSKKEFLTLNLVEKFFFDQDDKSAQVDSITARDIEHFLLQHVTLDDEDFESGDDSNQKKYSAVFYRSEDSILLKCQGAKSDPLAVRKEENDGYVTTENDAQSILGIDSGLQKLDFHFYEPTTKLKQQNNVGIDFCHCSTVGQRCGGNWSCPDSCIPTDTDLPAKHVDSSTLTSVTTCHLKIVDLSPFQRAIESERNHHNSFHAYNDQIGVEQEVFSMQTSGLIFHALRSIVTCKNKNSHATSPWVAAYRNSENNNISSKVQDELVNQIFEENQNTNKTSANTSHPNTGHNCTNDCTVGIILRDSYEDVEEQAVIEKFVTFRTGDASPSFYLHSATRLDFSSCLSICDHMKRDLNIPYFKAASTYDEEERRETVILLIYRHLPCRSHLTHKLPRDVTHDNIELPSSSTNSGICAGCRWEAYLPQPPTPESHSVLQGLTPKQIPPSLRYRLVSPPYFDLFTAYPHLPLHSLLAPSNMNILIQEATSIPLWTAWPETQHYSSNSSTDSTHPSWTVFPICHCFPSTNISRRKFIPTTCAHIPQTTKLLLQIFGDTLRTALFSRLQPDTVLEPHTGWADLANHVLRLHIPLVIPVGGLCGLWVDGCVEEQRMGTIHCFDDSKVHRAFNYSDEERVVLIIDLIRYSDDADGPLVPIGTAVGGHSDELDAFIAKFSAL